jgi:hypothetical protein
MRSFISSLFAIFASAATAWAAPMDAQRYRVVLELAREYADDRTLIFYCLRGDSRRTPFLWYGVHVDLAEALALVQHFFDDPAQHAELVRTVLANVRTFAPEAKDPARDAQCKAKDVEKALETKSGVGVPLIDRPPFGKIGR